jgi:hypothetical protein
LRPACFSRLDLTRNDNLALGLLAALCAAPPTAHAAAPVAATAPDDARDTVRAVPLLPGERIVLDGTLNHPAWQRAPAHGRFTAKDPVFGVAPPQRTEFRVLFDGQALYVGVRAYDDAPELIRDPVVRADQVNRTQDFVVVYIDAIGSRRSAQFFRVNAAGSTADGLHTAADNNEDFSPDFDWDAATSRQVQGPEGQRGWTAVFRLPFASLRYASDSHDWRILVGRRLPREHQHLMTSAPIPRDVPSFIHTLQPLTGVVIPQDSQFVTVRPSLTLRRQRDSGPDVPAQAAPATEASLDVKWRPRAELVVDGTLNPDFSQVALDVPQLAGNSRYALYFPEKRPFFFESADLLRTPTEAFYTRSYAQPRGGLRATWRDTAWAGTALALNDKGGGLVLLPGAYGTDTATQPASQAVALRARSDGGALQWGGVAAARRYTGGGGDNAVAGPDLAWQMDDAWRLRAQWLGSQTSARADSQGGLLRGNSQGGQKRYLHAQYQGSDSEADIGYEDTSAGFRHDSGFVNQAGVRQVHGWYNRLVGKGGPFDEIWVNAELNHTSDWQGGDRQGQTVQSSWRPGVWTRGASGLEWWAECFGHSKLRTAATAPLLAERFGATGFSVTPARWFPLLEGKLIAGQLADTAANRVRPGGNTRWAVRLRPLPRLEVEASTSAAWLRNDGPLAYREAATQLLGVWHFNAHHTLRGIVQRTALDRRSEPGVDAARDRGQVTSLTYTWRESAGTQLYVGASRGRQQSFSAEPTRTQEVFVKLQFDLGEARRAWSAPRPPLS